MNHQEYLIKYKDCRTFKDLEKLTEEAKAWEKEYKHPITPDWYIAHGFTTSSSAVAKKPFDKQTNPDGWTLSMYERNLVKWRIKNEYN